MIFGKMLLHERRRFFIQIRFCVRSNFKGKNILKKRGSKQYEMGIAKKSLEGMAKAK